MVSNRKLSQRLLRELWGEDVMGETNNDLTQRGKLREQQKRNKRRLPVSGASGAGWRDPLQVDFASERKVFQKDEDQIGPRKYTPDSLLEPPVLGFLSAPSAESRTPL